MKKLLAVVLVGLFALVVASPASADTISITVGGTGPLQFPSSVTPPANAPWGVNGYPGDTVELTGTTFDLELTPGTSIHKINTLLWTVDYTYGGTATDPSAWADLFFDFNLSRTISLGADPLQQPGR